MSEENNPETHGEVQSPGATLADDFYAVEKPIEAAPIDPPADPETPPDPTDEVPADPPADHDDAFEPTSFEQLAEHLETDPKWFEGLTITQKVNGKPVEVKLADALSTHRKVAAADDYLADAKAKAKATIEEVAAEKQAIFAGAAVFGELLQAAEADLEKDTKDIDWAKLRRDDPAEYSAKKEEIRERQQALAEKKQKAVQTFQLTTQQLTQQQNMLREQNLPNEQQVLLERVPEWGDPELAQREQSELVNYLTADGYTQEDINIAAYNGKLLSMAVKAMRYDQSKGKVEAAKKKVVKIPKVMRPGKPSEETKPKVDSDDRVSILYGSKT